LLLYSLKPSLGVYQLAGHLLQANKFSGTIITTPSMVVYVFYCNAQSKLHSDILDISRLSLFYQLPNCNSFTQHVLFILWRDTTSELWTPVLFTSYCYHLFTLLALLIFLAYYYHFPLDTLITFVSSKPVRLTTSS
jgi:hypothetical protein